MRQISEYVIDTANGKDGVGLPEMVAKYGLPKAEISPTRLLTTESVSKPVKPKSP